MTPSRSRAGRHRAAPATALALAAALGLTGCTAGDPAPPPTTGPAAATNRGSAAETPVQPASAPAGGSPVARARAAGTPPPTRQARPYPTPTEVPPPTPTVPPTTTRVPTFVSAGLGLSRDEWDRLMGPPASVRGGVWFDATDTRRVAFAEGHVAQVDYRWGELAARPLGAARTEARALLPRDAEHVRTFRSIQGLTVDLFHSPTLADRFGDRIWAGSTPGDCTAIYQHARNGLVVGVVVVVGNNP